MHRIYQGGVFTSASGDKLFAVASNSDIVESVRTGQAGFALLGSDKWDELPEGYRAGLCFEVVGKLPCQFVLAAPEGVELGKGDRIATSYPMAWAGFAAAMGVCCQLGPVLKGKVEGAPARGIAEGIYDLTETGESLAANNLRIVRRGPFVKLGGLWRRLGGERMGRLFN